jgi:hypothetical protein
MAFLILLKEKSAILLAASGKVYFITAVKLDVKKAFSLKELTCQTSVTGIGSIRKAQNIKQC